MVGNRILAQEGRLRRRSQGGAGSGVPAAAARTAPREVRDSARQALSLGADKLPSAPVPLPETAARVPGRKSPRWSAERGPGRTGAWWSRLARATKRKSAPVGAPLTPRSGGMGLLLSPRLRAGPPAEASAKVARSGKTNPGARTRRGNEEDCAV